MMGKPDGTARAGKRNLTWIVGGMGGDHLEFPRSNKIWTETLKTAACGLK